MAADGVTATFTPEKPLHMVSERMGSRPSENGLQTVGGGTAN